METLQLTISDAVSVLVFWLIVVHRWHRQCAVPLPSVPQVHPSQLENPPLVSVIVPARNEAHQIARCVRSLLAQDYPRLEVIAVDDCSEDETGESLARLAEADRRLTVVHGRPLPEGWMGKAHAIYQGYRVARGEWLLFTDADTEHAPFLLSGVMARILSSPASVATVLGRQRHPTVGVYLANLAVFTYIFMVTDRRGFSDPRSRQSLVNGQYLIFSREAYEAVGTHEAVRQYSSTDVSLGYLAKLTGFVPLMIDGRDALWTTMYRSLAEAFHGWSRGLVNGIWTALGPGLGSAALVALTAGLWLFWVAPWFLVVRGTVRAGSVDLVVGSVQVLAGLVVLRLKSGRWLSAVRDAIPMPLSFTLFTAMVVEGLARAWYRGGAVWKGRIVRTGQRLPPWNPKAVRSRYAGS